MLGALVLAVLRAPALRVLLTGGACVVRAAVVGAYVVVQQYRFRYPYEFFWVEHFDAVTNLAWLAVLLLAADACLELVRSDAVTVDRCRPAPVLRALTRPALTWSGAAPDDQELATRSTS